MGMTKPAELSPDRIAMRASRLLWPPVLWPANDREIWVQGCAGVWPEGLDNPAAGWSPRTVKKNQDGYGYYLSWLCRNGMLYEDEDVSDRMTPTRLAHYIASLKADLAPASVGTMVAALAAAVRALAPTTDWSWLSRRAGRLKLKAKPTRDKRQAIRHTIDVYRYGKHLMETADIPKHPVASAQRYQAGLIIALLAARPLRIRNFQALTISESLRWDGERYWLTFSSGETKMRMAIDEPIPDDLRPYLEAFLRNWRPILLRQAKRHGGTQTHRRLWVDIHGAPMKENTLRSLIERYTKKGFGTAIWPHLFRDCLLTSLAVDEPDLMRISATLLGHASTSAGEKHYNQARMVDASRRYGDTISAIRTRILSAPEPEQDVPVP